MAKPKHTPSQQAKINEYQKELKRLKSRVYYAKKKGYFFEKNPIPETPKRITTKSIQALKELTSFELSKKATFFITPEGEALDPKFGRIKQQKPRTERQIIASYTNLAKAQIARKTAKSKQDYIARNNQSVQKTGKRIPFAEKGYDIDSIRGKAFVDIYFNLLGAQGEDTAQSYLDTLSAEEYERFIDAYNIYSKKEADQRISQGKKRAEANETKRREILPDKSKEVETPDEDYRYSEDYKSESGEDLVEDEGYEYSESDDYYSEPEPSYDAERKSDRKSRRTESEEDDEDLSKWKEEYSRQIKKPKKEREFIYEGDSIYQGIRYRINTFQAEFNEEDDKHAHNKQYQINFNKMLNNAIQTEGYDKVMKRMQGHGIEIDNAIERMLYGYKDEASDAFMYLSEIIQGRAMSQQESFQMTEAMEKINWMEEDEDLLSKAEIESMV